MCDFKREIKNKTQFTGYKVAAKNINTGKYYSPCTGVEYLPGLIPVPKKQRKITSVWRPVLDPDCRAHNPSYKGMTAVFKELVSAKKALSNWSEEAIERGFKLVILKMTIQKTKDRNCWEGIYTNVVYVGPKIRSMKELE